MENYVFSFHAISVPKKKTLTALIEECGGTVVYVGRNITHLVTTPEELAENTFKIQQALKNNINVVTEEFIHNLAAKFPKSQNFQPEKKVTFKDSTAVQSISIDLVETLSPKTVISFPTPVGVDVPSINLILPSSGPTQGNFKVAVFGLNFKANSQFHLQFGKYKCTEIEYHCSTAVIATIRTNNLPPGEVQVSGTNDGGIHYGTSSSFRFYDPEMSLIPSQKPEDNALVINSQLQNLKRTIFELQTGLMNAHKMELELHNRFDKMKVPQSDSIEVQIEIETLKEEQKEKESLSQRNKRKTVNIHKELPIPKSSNREIRVFISSTFRDMQDERDLLVKRVFPKIRKICSERDVSFSYVDLRWGVTGVQNEQAATLLMCLREIEKCNIFIGMFGERYGWCLSQGSHRSSANPKDDLLKRSFDLAEKEFPWITEYRDRSVTELEMQMVLKKHYTGDDKLAYFYFRDPYYIEEVPADKKSLFKSEGEHEAKKLQKIKEVIESSEYPTTHYTKPNILEEFVESDLRLYMDIAYPMGSELSPIESERFRHNSFSKSLLRTYLNREEYFLALDKHVSSSIQTPFLVLGESGIGKSALVANWSKRYKEHHPEDIVITHFIGCSSSSTNHLEMMKRILRELQDALSDYKSEIPGSSKELTDIFPQWIEKVLTRNKKHRLVIIIDGLDYIDERENATAMLWLPKTFPSSIRVILSASKGSCSSVLERRDCETMTIEPLNEAERTSFLRMYLNLNSKKLSEKQEFTIAGKPQAGNPRYLMTLIEDISVWGEYEELDKKIERDLQAKNSSELYEIVLSRLEDDYDNEKQITKKFLSLLWASRRGLHLEAEMALLLEEDDIEQHEWSQIYLVLEDFLFNSGGMLKIANRDMYKAVNHRYLQDVESTKRVHNTLATFFSRLEGFTERKIEEVPFQLEKAENLDELQRVLSDLRYFNELYKPNYKYELSRYWRKVEKELHVDPVNAYSQALSYTDLFPSGEVVAEVFFKVANFLEDMAKYEGAESVYLKARYHYYVTSQNLEVANMDYCAARVQIARAKYKEAEENLKKALEIFYREKGEDSLDAARILTRLGSLYTSANRFKEAEQAFLSSLRIREATLGSNHSRVGQTLKHMVTFYEEQGNYAKAAECGERALKITEEVFGLDDENVGQILLRLGHLYMLQTRFDLAKKTLKRALNINQDKFGAEHPNTADVLYELGCLYFIRPDKVGKKKINKAFVLDKAEELMRKSLAIAEKTLGKDHPSISRILNRLGSLCIERVEFETAEQYLKKALKIREEKYGIFHSRVAQSLKHLFTLYELQEKFPDALNMGKRIVNIYEKLYGSQSLQVANVLLRVGSLHFLMDGNTSYEGKHTLQRVIEIRKKKLGDNHQLVLEAQKLLDEFERPPQPDIPPPPIPQQKQQYVIVEEQNTVPVDEWVFELNADIQTRAPPPPPPPPPPPSTLSSSKPVIHVLRDALLNDIENAQQRKNYESAGWWKQNYKFQQK